MYLHLAERPYATVPLLLRSLRARVYAAALVTAALAAFLSPAAAQGFGYNPASPDIGVVRVAARAFLSGPTATWYPASAQAFTARDSSGFAAGSRIIFEFDEMYAQHRSNFTRAEVVGICTDYNATNKTCATGWVTATNDAQSLVVTFPTLAAGSEVVSRSLGVRVRARQYASDARELTAQDLEVAQTYFLVPPPDHFFRDNSGNEVAIWRQRTQATGGGLNRPIVIAEGIDLGDRTEPDEVFGQIGALTNVVRAGGYDVAIVSFGSPLLSVRDHQIGLQNAIQLVHQMKASAAQPTAVIGLSRGGVVARYALAKMEESGIPHNTSLFISYDSPQRGANLNLNLQRYLFGLPKTPKSFEDVVDQLKSVAVRELLQEHATNIDSGQDLYQNFYADLRSLNRGTGYPQNLRRVAWSNGSWNTPWFNRNTFVSVTSTTPGVSSDIELTTADRVAGSFLPPSLLSRVDGRTGDVTAGNVALGVILGGLGTLVKAVTLGTQDVGGFFRATAVNKPTFIPTASALDRNDATAPTPFHRAETSSTRRSHDAVPPDAARLILVELGFDVPLPPPPRPTNFRVTNPSATGQNAALAWDAPTSGSPTSYKVYRRCIGTVYTNSNCTPTAAWGHIGTTTGQTFIDGFITVQGSGGAEYTLEYRATAVNTGGESTPSNSASVGGRPPPWRTMLKAASIPEVFAVHGVQPNPVRVAARIKVDLPEPSAVSVRVYDLVGRVVLMVPDTERPAGSHLINVDVNSLSTGTYIYQVQAGAEEASGRFTVVR